MKYVMFTHTKTGIKAPVFCADSFCHDSMRADPSWLPTSAGYYNPQTGQCSGESKSLRLKTAEDDGILCSLVMANMESMLIASQDLDENKAQLLKQWPGAKT